MSRRRHVQRRVRHHVWRMPVALGVLTVAGLALGLVYDGLLDWVAVAALAVPLAVAAWHAYHPARRRRP